MAVKTVKAVEEKQKKPLDDSDIVRDEGGKTATIQFGAAYHPILEAIDNKSYNDTFLVEGPRGSGKTRSVLTAFLANALTQPGQRILLARRDRTLMTETVLATLEEQVFPLFNLRVPGKVSRYHRTDYRLPSPIPGIQGSVLVPLGMADKERMYSSEWTKAYVAEATEESEKEVRDLFGAMRYLRSEERPYLPERKLVVLDCNPVEPEHWLNLAAAECPDYLRHVGTRQDYERLYQYNMTPNKDGKFRRIVTKHHDNPGYWDTGKWCFRSLGREYVENTLKGYFGATRKRWLDGLWAAAEGAVFPEWSREVHVEDDFEPPREWPQCVGFDPGYHHPRLLWFCMCPDGNIVVYDEYGVGKLPMSEHCEEIHRRNRRYGRNILRYFGDPQEAFSKRAQGASCAMQARECGIELQPWPATNLKGAEAMVNAVRELVVNAVKREETMKVGGIFLTVCRRCVMTIAEMETWAYAKASDGESLKGDNKYEDRNQHSIDILRGVVASRFLQTMLLRRRAEQAISVG